LPIREIRKRDTRKSRQEVVERREEEEPEQSIVQ